MDTHERREARAVCGAYLMVAYADANLKISEEHGFLSTTATQAAFQHMDAAILEEEFKAVLAAMGTDYRAAAARILDDIEWARTQGRALEAIQVSARSAIVADENLNAQEEAALDEIERALGLEKGVL